MKTKLAIFSLSLAASTLAYYLAQTKAKGMDSEISELVSQVLGLIRDNKYPNYRPHKSLAFTVQVLESERKSIWSTFNLEGRGRERFEIACLRQIGEKARRSPRKFKENPLDYLQPELAFLDLLGAIQKIEEKKRPRR